jgi:AcrR family transcriptional regulator
MTADPQTPLRADARRNRDQIIAAARTIFAEHGTDVPMEEIARTAGVGVGTLYRRFPDREALIRAVAVDGFARMLADARAAAQREPTAWDALVHLLRGSTELQLTLRLSLVSELAIATLRTDPAIRALRADLLDELERLVRSAQQEGSLRDDVGVGDVAQLFSLRLRQPHARTPELATMASDRWIAIMLDGLQVRARTALPWRPLTTDDLFG